MASYFNLILDTLAPAGVSIIINDGAEYTTSQAVTLTIATSDSNTTGYQIRIFDSYGCVIHVIQGYIYIRKAHKPYTQNPLDTGGER